MAISDVDKAVNNFRISRTLGCVLAAAAMVAPLAACGDDVPARADEPGAPIRVEQVDTLGDIVVQAEGMTVYAFEGDTATVSGCQGPCLKNWPIVAAPEPLPASASAISGPLGVIVREDGARQLTLGSHPLYTFIQDTAPGQHNGVGKKLGDLRWGVVLADGITRY